MVAEDASEAWLGIADTFSLTLPAAPMTLDLISSRLLSAEESNSQKVVLVETQRTRLKQTFSAMGNLVMQQPSL